MGVEEVGADDVVVGKRGRRYSHIGGVLRCGGTFSSVIWAIDVGYVPVCWEDLGGLPPQGGPQTSEAATTEGTGWDVGVPPAGGGDGGGGNAVCGDLRIPPS